MKYDSTQYFKQSSWNREAYFSMMIFGAIKRSNKIEIREKEGKLELYKSEVIDQKVRST